MIEMPWVERNPSARRRGLKACWYSVDVAEIGGGDIIILSAPTAYYAKAALQNALEIQDFGRLKVAYTPIDDED